jgi:hypothetical protein
LVNAKKISKKILIVFWLFYTYRVTCKSNTIQEIYMLKRIFLAVMITTFGYQGLHAHPPSSRTLSIAITLTKNLAALHSYTLKDHAFALETTLAAESYYQFGQPIPLTLTLSGQQGPDFVRELTVGPICLDHEANEPPHIMGDTIYLHKDTFVIEMPELPGYDTVSITMPIQEDGVASAQSLGSFKLDRAHFDPNIHGFTYDDLRFANKLDKSESVVAQSSTVLWPEAFGDSAKFKVFGNEYEGNTRINVLIIPDGYTYAQKATMEQHAQAMIQAFRSRTPYKEHDHLINYTLVYAYSLNSGTDQCDCGIVLDTAMGTGFQNSTHICGHSDNRCLYYSNPCDASAENNIVAAEQRAPFADTTIVMVNTARYGGCGGARAVYSAANQAATEVALHELGHSLGGLADEYGGYPSCGGYAGGINTSVNATQGNWSEWIPEIGAPKQGGQYYEQCIYRPETNCEMRALGLPFCRVCTQQFSRVFYGHPRVSATAPLKNPTPTTSTISLPQGGYTVFRYETRLSNQTTVTNASSFYLKGPGEANFTKLPVSEELWIRFMFRGVYQVKAEVTADVNFIKPVKTGANQDAVIWNVNVGLSNNQNMSPLTPNDGPAYQILEQQP